MSARRIGISLLAFTLIALALPASASASAAETPAWKISSVSLPTNFAPESKGTLFLVANNLGAKVTEGEVTLTDVVPEELEILKVEGVSNGVDPRVNDPGAADPDCVVAEQTVTCTDAGQHSMWA